ncbi:MAG: AI-2E family transporter [Cyclobacteriaceae bacterium]|nr:AI-2E family transporter [Cyclobacteriaceae bacterium]
MGKVKKRAFKVERTAAWLIVLAIFIFCLNYFSTFLQPVLIAVMIWYSIYEMKRLLERVKIKGKTLPTWLRTVVAMLVILLVTVGIYQIITLNLELIINKSPEYAANFKSMIDELSKIEWLSNIQGVFINLENFNIQPMLTGFLNSLTSIAGNIVVIAIYVAFLLAEEKFFYKKLLAVSISSRQQKKLDTVIEQVTEAIRKYMSIKTQMSLLTGVLGYIVLILFGVDFPVLWAFLIFLLNYIPYVGSFIATLLPAVFAMFQFQSFLMMIWIFITVQVVQMLTGNVLEPKLMGRTLNLSPLGVMLALTFWGVIWGVLGMFLSVPITSVMLITFSRFDSTRPIAIWLSETGELDY